MITRIEDKGVQAGPLVRQWSSLYCQLSTKELPTRVHGLDDAFFGLLVRLYTAQGQPAPAFDDVTPLRFKYRLHGNPGRALVAFTGGKDSTATALALRREGIDVTLFYVRGLNSASYSGEHQYATRVAEVLGMPLVQYHVQQTGKPELPDNPVKNQYVLALMVEYGQAQGFAHFAQGNLCRETLAETALGYTTTDAAELYEAAGLVFNTATLGSYTYLGGLMQYESQSFATIAEVCPQALDALMSCIQPYRFRQRVRQANESKYGVSLRAEMCGTCYKCATEYIHRVLLGLVVPVPAYVARCVSILQEAQQRLARLPELPGKREAVEWFVEPSIISTDGLEF